METVVITVARSHPSPHSQSYTLDFEDGLTLLGALRVIAETQDPTLAFRNNHCGRGVCTSCLVKVDGVVQRACCVPLLPGKNYSVGPANDRVIRDLAVEL